MRQKISWTTRLAMSRRDVRDNMKAGVERNTKISEPLRDKRVTETLKKQRILLDKRLLARATYLPQKRAKSFAKFEQREQRLRKHGVNLRSYCSTALMDINMDYVRHRDKIDLGDMTAPTTRLLMRKVLLMSKPSRGLSERHRKNISNSIAKKWREQKYRKRVRTGMRKFQRTKAASQGYVCIN